MVLTFSLGHIAMQHLTKLHSIHIYTVYIVQVTVNIDIAGTATHVHKVYEYRSTHTVPYG